MTDAERPMAMTVAQICAVVPDAEDALLRAMTHMLRAGERPNSQELLARAQEDEPALLAGWTAKAVERALGPFNVRPAEVPALQRAGGVIPKVVLLWVLGYMIACGESPDSQQVLEGAREVEPVLFANWSSRGVRRALAKYGCVTFKGHRRRDYSRVTLDDLRRIETKYGCNLGLPEPEPEPERARAMLADGA